MFIILFWGAVYATPEIAQKTGEDCNICHPTKPSELGPVGEYYEEHGTLEGYGEMPKGEREPGGRCNVCHAQLEPDPTPRELAGPTSPNHQFELKHGEGRFWCLTCHDPVNRDKLRLLNGEKIGFDESTKLCSQCHGKVFKDWTDHIHGKWVGEWGEEAKPEKVCVDCHDPHDPVFGKLVPEPAPEKPPQSPHFENYNLYSVVVLLVAIGLAAFAARK